MRILFVTSEHPGYLFGGLGTFTREYVRELRKYCDVKCVYFHLREGPAPEPDETVDVVLAPKPCFDAFNPDARILEVAASFRSQLDPLIKSFKPDVIHCNDRQTYMPFRFDRNVFYSSHLIFTDLISNSCMDDLYFQEVKVERCALESSAVVAVYSEFAARSVEKLAGRVVSPVVLPLGIRTEKFKHKKHSDGKLHVCYFGRFENTQKGVNDFIYAVNRLGPKFKKRYNVEYHLYGRGKIDVDQDLSLFNRPEFLEGEALFEAYSNADIVVMPSRYEPFGLTGLEAMASGALLLVTSGLGMDEYAEPGRNCIELPKVASEMTGVIRDAVMDFHKYEMIRENGIRSAKEWTWFRCVRAHMYFYRLMAEGKVPQLCSAYRKDERDIIRAFRQTNDVEKIFTAEHERIGFSLLYDSMSETEKREKILVLTGCLVPEDGLFPKNVRFVPVMVEGKDGVVVRPECLPFRDCEFDRVIVAGAWESVVEPCGALMEFERVSKKQVTVLYRTGLPESWQTFQMESEDDWRAINKSSWDLGCVEALLSQKLKQTVPFGAVNFRNHSSIKEAKNEIIA